MLLLQLPNAPAGPEFTFILYLINILQKQITVAFNYLTTLKNLNTTTALKLMKLRSYDMTEN